jgi:putative two-component system response regulator
MASQIALTHHERWDGTGYPHGLKGRDIPLCGRIMALADVYDALTSKRVYKPPFDHDVACSMIRKASGSHFDPELIEAFIRVEKVFAAEREKHNDTEKNAA